jgi:hypothetical protein
LSKQNHISASVLLCNNTVYKNGKAVFESEGVGLSDFLTAVYEHWAINYPKFHKMDNLSKLGFLASEILLKESFSAGDYRAEEVGVVLANASASLDTDIKYYKTVHEMASPALFVYTLPNIAIGEICIRNRFKGENAFFISRDFDAGFIEQYVSNLINNNILQACICGWLELMEQEYKAVLFLVEKEKSSELNSAAFTTNNINKIYQLENG